MARKKLYDTETTKTYTCLACSAKHNEAHAITCCPICGEAQCPDCSTLHSIGYCVENSSVWTHAGVLRAHRECIEQNRDAMERAIRSSVPKGTEALNLRAFRSGREYAPEREQAPRRQDTPPPREETACPPRAN